MIDYKVGDVLVFKGNDQNFTNGKKYKISDITDSIWSQIIFEDYLWSCDKEYAKKNFILERQLN